jgi:hypothetical protein
VAKALGQSVTVPPVLDVVPPVLNWIGQLLGVEPSEDSHHRGVCTCLSFPAGSSRQADLSRPGNCPSHTLS